MHRLHYILPALLAITAGCESPKEPGQTKDVQVLQDSIKLLKDSIHDLRAYFPFNTISARVCFENWKIKAGDSCEAKVFISAFANEDLNRMYPNGLTIHSDRLSSDPIPHRQDRNTWWTLKFKPDFVGLDTIRGTIQVPTLRRNWEPLQVTFATGYEVLPK